MFLSAVLRRIQRCLGVFVGKQELKQIPRFGSPAIDPLRLDLLAGLTAAAVVLPKAMAYATVAGLPVAAGLFTAFVPMLVYALLGTSSVLSVSSTATLAILAGANLTIVVPDGDPDRMATAGATLVALTGVLLLLASLLRLGFVANFISLPVLAGFKAGIGLVIILDQAPKLLGIHIVKQGFFRDAFNIVQSIPETSLLTLVIAIATMAVLAFFERKWPHSPAPLIAVGGGIAASWVFGLQGHGVGVVGPIPQGLPSLRLPDPEMVQVLLPGAFGIALMSFTETVAAGRAFALPTERPVKANRELLAIGAANVAGSFLGAMPAGGGTSQTAVVRAVGGRTQRVSLVTALVAFATMLFLAPPLGLLPHAVLAAVVIVYSAGLIQLGEIAAIRRVRLMEFRWAIAAFAGVMVFGALNGIIVAIILSLITLSSQEANPKVYVIGRRRDGDVLRPISPEFPDDQTIDGLLILRPEGRLFFANAQLVADQIKNFIAENQPRVVVLDMSRVFDVEYSALRMLIEEEQRITNSGIALWFAGLGPGATESVKACGLADRLGSERLFVNARAAIRHYEDHILKARD